MWASFLFWNRCCERDCEYCFFILNFRSEVEIWFFFNHFQNDNSSLCFDHPRFFHFFFVLKNKFFLLLEHTNKVKFSRKKMSDNKTRLRESEEAYLITNKDYFLYSFSTFPSVLKYVFLCSCFVFFTFPSPLLFCSCIMFWIYDLY